MKTDDLIRALAADHAARAPSLERALARAVALGLAISAALFAAILGPRPDLAVVIGEPRFAFKLLLTLLLAASSFMLASRLARPARDTKRWWLVLAAVPVLLAAAVLTELSVLPAGSWSARLIGSNAALCLASVPLLAVPVLLAALAVLRRSAPLRPGVTGAVAGLCAGGLGAALYATHCIDDSPLFVATWYGVAIAGTAIAGASAGRTLLRW
jgi:hypothetical protein